MKKLATVTGIQHKSGISANTQKPYDFYVLHVTYPDPDTEGYATSALILPDSEVETIVIGNQYYLFTHFYKGKECFDALLFVG